MLQAMIHMLMLKKKLQIQDKLLFLPSLSSVSLIFGQKISFQPDSGGQNTLKTILTYAKIRTFLAQAKKSTRIV